ncbi:MAG TPA: acyltransferase [Bacteroidales bacterium]|nr:acyltransferase [Bacteroidales bacterium]
MKKAEALELIKLMRMDNEVRSAFMGLMIEMLDLRNNPFHPLVFINGNPEIGNNVYVGLFSEIYSKGAKVKIGDNCDIASFVAINCADSHKKGLGISDKIEKKDITLENNVFVGSHSVIKGGAYIGHHSIVGAGTIVEGVKIPPYSLVIGNPMVLKEGYYLKKL